MKAVSHSEVSLIELNKDGLYQEQGRVFNHSLNKTRAKTKLLEGAKRTKNLEVEKRDGCVNLRFCDGSYFEVILPLLKNLHNNEVIQINDKEVQIIEVDAGVENSKKHVDTKIVVNVNGDRFVLHAYNSTQNLMVQGRNYEKFATDCLKPYFLEKFT